MVDWFDRTFGVAVVTLVPVGLLLPRVIPVIFGIVALLAVARLVSERNRRPNWPKPEVIVIGALAAWSVASALWSLSPANSLRSSWSLVLLIAGGFSLVVAAPRLSARHRRWVESGIVVSVIFGALMVLIDSNTNLSIVKVYHYIARGGRVRPIIDNSAFSRGMAVLALLAWPATSVLWRRGYKLAAILLPAFITASLISGESITAGFALAVGAGALVVALATRKAAAVLFSLLIVIGFVMAPNALESLPDGRTISKTVPGLGYSVYPRIFIWQSSARFIAERPILGFGFRSARLLSSNKDSQSVRVGPTDLNKVMVEPIPLHPHNAPLQLRLELGIVGVLLAAFATVCLIRRIARRREDLPDQALQYATLFSALTIASISFGFWQGWWQSVLWLLAALCAMHFAPAKNESAAG